MEFLFVNFLHHVNIEEITEFHADLLHNADNLESKDFVQMDADVICLGDAGNNGMEPGFSSLLN
jgi:hypothetical protein